MKNVLVLFLNIAVTSAAFGGFASNEVFLASIGRGGGGNGAQFYSTLWVTNLSSSATVHFTFFFLKDGQSNLTGDPSFNDTLAPGQTKLYENVTETKLSLPGQFGAARITADGEIFASERVYNLAHATDNLGTSEGLFFAAVPKAFAIGLGGSRCEIWELTAPVCELARHVAPDKNLRALDSLHLATYRHAAKKIDGLELLTADERLRAAAE